MLSYSLNNCRPKVHASVCRKQVDLFPLNADTGTHLPALYVLLSLPQLDI